MKTLLFFVESGKQTNFRSALICVACVLRRSLCFPFCESFVNHSEVLCGFFVDLLWPLLWALYEPFASVLWDLREVFFESLTDDLWILDSNSSYLVLLKHLLSLCLPLVSLFTKCYFLRRSFVIYTRYSHNHLGYLRAIESFDEGFYQLIVSPLRALREHLRKSIHEPLANFMMRQCNILSTVYETPIVFSVSFYY